MAERHYKREKVIGIPMGKEGLELWSGKGFRTCVNIRKGFQRWTDLRGKAWKWTKRLSCFCSIHEWHWFCYVSQHPVSEFFGKHYFTLCVCAFCGRSNERRGVCLFGL